MRCAPVLLFRCCDESTRHADARFYRQRHSPALTFRADAATKSGQQVGRGVTAPRGLALPGRSPWQGRRFARPLHPTRAGGLSRPPCTPTTKRALPLGTRVRLSRPTPRRGTRPGSSTFAQPCAGLDARSGPFAAPTPHDQRRSALDRKSEEPCSSDTASVRLSRPTPRRKAFRLSTPDQARAAWIGASVRRWTRPGGAMPR